MRWMNVLLMSGFAVTLLAAGCTTTQQGAAVGGAAGATVGGIWAHNAGLLDPAEGAFVGLAAGGLAGALVGDALDEMQSCRREQELQAQIGALEAQLQGKDVQMSGLQGELDRVRAELASKPAVAEAVQVEVTDGTIRFTILNEVLFDSGKAELKGDGLATLDEVVELIQKEFPDRRVMVEGHTDADPIKVSGWASNWELSAARSLAVVHYMIDKKNAAPERVCAAAFGEFRPVASNDSAENKRLNRRAVLVVLPADSKIVVERK